MTYYPELLKFLKQANTGNLRTKEYSKSYNGVAVKVSFGQGGSARIPWISFLLPPNKTSDGIYPVYLYFKAFDILILAYGLSETTLPKFNWNEPQEETVDAFVKRSFNKVPARYGGSQVYKAYDIKNLPNEEQINNGLNNLLDLYKRKMGNVQSTEILTKEDLFNIKAFSEGLKQAGLIYSENLIKRFVASLITKPFLILTGLSGSGKTKLAQAFVQWICASDHQYKIVPVGADWTNREPLLGYPNALNQEEYIKPESGALDLIISAMENPEVPYFLILDEMNLSIVERYFADFLSVMESGDAIRLHSGPDAKSGVPPFVTMPDNLFIIGTVNIDETTHMFSPKVLDRANTLEFRIRTDEMKNFLDEVRTIKMAQLKNGGTTMAGSFLELARQQESSGNESETRETLLNFFGQLKKLGAEFGYRSASEILRLIHSLEILDNSPGGDPPDERLDIAIVQKLLPKLHGSRRKLCPVLEKLGSFCVKLKPDENVVTKVFDDDSFDYSTAVYPLTLEKIARMYRSAIDNGFASFAEA